jgi:hypothetical protein
LTDKADTAALNYVWRELHDVGALLGAVRVIATAGNHDIDSRLQNSDFDPKGALQALVPPFPGLSEPECDRYWARNFVLLENSDWRLLLLNSSAFHGVGKDPSKEMAHGRVSERTVSAIEQALSASDKKSFNLLVCHHHLYRDNAIHETDYSEMEGADHLLRLIDAGAHGQWVVIHGHKHHPKLQYGPGSTGAPVVFSAGSLSACLYATLATRARNQFYILQLDSAAAGRLQLDVAGRLTAWDWIPNSGWQEVGAQSGISYLSGFGYRATSTLIASKIAALVNNSPFLRWKELVQSMPEVNFLIPADVDNVLNHLKSAYAIRATRDNYGAVSELMKS